MRIRFFILVLFLAVMGPLALSQESSPPAGQVRVNPKDGLKYVWIPPGTFMMGCSPGDHECSDDETLAHQVTITGGFWIGQTPVTVGAYKRFVGAAPHMPHSPHFKMPHSPGFNKGWANENMPIVYVDWFDALAYCSWAGGRLPTEAEWEYAARGGSTEARYGNLDDIAWYEGNSGLQRLDTTGDLANRLRRLKENGNGAHEVGLKRPNGFGLFDTLGNVWQWVNDPYDEFYLRPEPYYYSDPAQDPQGRGSGRHRVLRGGSWFDISRNVRVSSRWGCPVYRPTGPAFPSLLLTYSDYHIGFRCAGEVVIP